ncbi:NAD(P)-binding protein [Zopfia rhizophila CBS 207.26]|uniref:NAD(P)-binding protein n=1 Tax=Zopfia rhizophila CBS 207.26 TaxID=1314779 RepID=A0A6A6D9T2_9PEZI|nr:NAD(P)-binding protein [Zopfia rhizophila CBS 207.26]KAF2175836.1 NAD(P)-binding protein [Zopfia rhizophila CBS 207.26]
MTAQPQALTIGIAGLTGKFARLVASSLLQRSNVILRGYVRNPTKLHSSLVEHSRVQVVQGEAYDLSAARSFAKGCDVIICAYLGDNKFMTEGQKVLIDACAAEGDPMIEVKEYLQQRRVNAVHILIGAFMDTFFSPYFQIWDGKEKKLRFWGEGNEVWESTSYKSAAEYVAAVAVEREAVGIKKFLGDRKTIQQIAEVFNSVYGFRPQIERLGSLDEQFELMNKLRREFPEEPMKYTALFYQYYCVNGQCHLGDFPSLDNAKYPEIQPETFEAFLRRMPLATLE